MSQSKEIYSYLQSRESTGRFLNGEPRISNQELYRQFPHLSKELVRQAKNRYYKKQKMSQNVTKPVTKSVTEKTYISEQKERLDRIKKRKLQAQFKKTVPKKVTLKNSIHVPRGQKLLETKEQYLANLADSIVLLYLPRALRARVICSFLGLPLGTLKQMEKAIRSKSKFLSDLYCRSNTE